jgi:hypothetical protein
MSDQINTPCPSCGREENGLWYSPCPSPDCPSVTAPKYHGSFTLKVTADSKAELLERMRKLCAHLHLLPQELGIVGFEKTRDEWMD